MAQPANQPSSAARRGNSTDLVAPNQRGEQGLRREQGLAGDRGEQGPRDEQREQWQHGERAEQGLRREQGLAGERDEQGQRGGQGQHWQRRERDEHGLRREPRRQRAKVSEASGKSWMVEVVTPDASALGGEQRTVVDLGADQLKRPTDWTKPATSTAVDILTPVLVVWGQVFASMFEMADAMVKLQQQTFASMMGTADTNAERMANGDHRGRIHDAVPASRTRSVVPDLDRAASAAYR